ncbi:alpha-1,2-fucosyltransferase [Spirochaetia bacterium]|nr:alpha-1,2-fucosyltransferase [Spirochaetia bacterium]
MIIVRLQGGIGNQLFIYSAYKKICEKFNDVYLDVSDYNLPFNSGYRKLLLTVFETEYQSITNGIISKQFCDKYITSKKLLEMNHIDFHLNINNYLNENLFNRLTDNSYIEGYFTNEKCFGYSILQKKIQFKKQINIKYKNLKNNIQSTNSISIHVRMGDYKNISDFKICTEEYYQKAISYISKKIDSPFFYIFSDELNKIKKYFDKYDNINYVDCTDTINSLMLMSSCKHNIIANSTFSWWGAWLNNFKNKIVMCPSKYYLSKPYTPYIDTWIHI